MSTSAHFPVEALRQVGEDHVHRLKTGYERGGTISPTEAEYQTQQAVSLTEDDVNHVPLQSDELRALADSLDKLGSAGATEAVVDLHDAGSVWVAWDDDVLALVVYVDGPVES